jgi:ubiquitin carboxyl-terminal hydrolase 5/13
MSHLHIGMGRYYVASDWTPKKLNVEVQMPDTLDLESLRARGPQPGEQLQPEGPAGATLPTDLRPVSAAGTNGLLPRVDECTGEQPSDVTSDGCGTVVSAFDAMPCRQHQRGSSHISGR